MPSSETNRLAALAALFALASLIFLAFGPGLLGLWPETLAAVAACLAAARVAQRAREGRRIFFALLAAALLCDLVNVLTFRRDLGVRVVASHDVAGGEIRLSFVFYGLFLFLWCCAWAYLLLRLLKRRRGGPVYFVAAIVLCGLVALYVQSYRGFDIDVLDPQQRLVTLLFALELVGLLLGLVSILLGLSRHFVLLAVGFSVFAAVDIVDIDLRLRGMAATAVELDPMWLLGWTLILGGLLTLPELSGRAEAIEDDGGTLHRHSALSAILLVVSLGSVFLVVVAGELIVERHWFAMFFVLFCVAVVVAMSRITARFDEAVRFTRAWLRQLFDRQLEPDDWRRGRSRTTRTLQLTALDEVLEGAAAGAGKLSEDVIFLGPERLNRPSGRSRSSESVTCFVMMPFGAEWSDAVARRIRAVCAARDVRAVRGDDIFTPTDILDDIWRGILDADFVIADITGRNTNVFYELGMAHAIGKPVVILSQSVDDVPIDLKTRRILMYDAADLGALEQALSKSVAEVLQQYRL